MMGGKEERCVGEGEGGERRRREGIEAAMNFYNVSQVRSPSMRMIVYSFKLMLLISHSTVYGL